MMMSKDDHNCGLRFIEEVVCGSIQFVLMAAHSFPETSDRRLPFEVASLKPVTVTKVEVIDLRFPTSREQIGSDAVNKDPDYSAAYCILSTDSGLKGHGLTFTLGRGTELVREALTYLSRNLPGRTLASITENLNAFYLELTGDTQF